MTGYPIRIEGVYTPKEIADKLGKSKQTLILWDKYSDELEAKGQQRLIPRPSRDSIGNRSWTEAQYQEIKEFSDKISYGSLAQFNRRRWGKRGESMVT